jgi:hypothetical protein
MHLHGGAQIPTYRNLIGRSRTAMPPVLSPSSILSANFVSWHSRSRKEELGTGFEVLLLQNFTFFGVACL